MAYERGTKFDLQNRLTLTDYGTAKCHAKKGRDTPVLGGNLSWPMFAHFPRTKNISIGVSVTQLLHVREETPPFETGNLDVFKPWVLILS